MSNNNQKPGLLIQLADALGEMLLGILMSFVLLLTWLAVFLWFFAFLNRDENPFATGSPFTLAQVAAIFGAFGLAGGFAGEVVPRLLRRKILFMGILYLISALGFSLLGMMLPALASSNPGTDANLVLTILNSTAFMMGAISFGAGNTMFLYVSYKLIKDKGVKGTEQNSSSRCNKVRKGRDEVTK